MRESANIVLVGRGNEDHPLLAIVGMNPGREECKRGLPFVGPSGKALASFLQRAGIDESVCYFTNVVKCSTPRNREPTVKEAKEWRSHLIEELRRVQPKVIVPLGNFAYKEICGRSGISRAVGQPRAPHERFGLPDAVVVPAYHPAYALRNPAFGEPIVVALSFAKRLADGSAPKVTPNIVWVDKLTTICAVESVTDQISKAEVLSYDIETNAREFNDPKFRIYLLAVDTGRWTFVFGPSEKSIRTGAVLVGLSNAATVGHNAIRFDAEALAKLEPTACKTLKHTTNDTMFLDYLLDENAKSHGLEAACHRVLGLAEWKSAVTWSWYETPPEEIPWETAVQYCANDASATRLLYDVLASRAQGDEGLMRIYNILRLASPAFGEIERNGFYIRTDYAERLIRERFTPVADQALSALQRMAGESFNPSSPKQVQRVLFDTFGVAPNSFTDTGQPSTDEVTLRTLHELYTKGPVADFCTNLLLYREANKLISTYLKAYVALAREGRIHPSYGLTTTVTGRTSCFKPNYENVPRCPTEDDPYIRGMIGAPDGKTFIQADYSQLELRVGAMVAQEENMLAAFVRGDDLHTLLAQEIAGRENVTKEERYAAKVANFSFLYGAEEYTFIEAAYKNFGIRFSMIEARRIRNAFFRRWQGLNGWYARCAQEIRDTGQIRSITGQIRRLPQIYAEDEATRVEALRMGINFTVQNPGAHIGILACAFLTTKLRSIDTFVVGFVHDAVHVETPTELRETTALTMRDIMEVEVCDYLKKIGVPITIPLVADIEWGPSWGELTKVSCSLDTPRLSANSTSPVIARSILVEVER